MFCWIFCFVVTDAAGAVKLPGTGDHHFSAKLHSHFVSSPLQNFSADYLNDSLPRYSVDTIVIPFEYKQSALFQPFTFKAIDSVIGILLDRDDVLLDINGYAHVDEAGDSICYYLSLNRALVIKDYLLGRGIDSGRITSLKGWGNVRSRNRKTNAEILRYNCRAEIMLSYPLPPPPLAVNDRDEDGVADEVDECPDEYGEILKYGCPDRSAIIVPFEPEQFSLFSVAYTVLDSVKAMLLRDPAISIIISGYAYKTEGVDAVCKKLANERADIVRRYLLSRGIEARRIISAKGLGKSKSLNAGRNPLEIISNARAEISLVRH
ncbi:MAG: OmpA family protein [Ferruginibacter sp.]